MKTFDVELVGVVTIIVNDDEGEKEAEEQARAWFRTEAQENNFQYTPQEYIPSEDEE